MHTALCRNQALHTKVENYKQDCGMQPCATGRKILNQKINTKYQMKFAIMNFELCCICLLIFWSSAWLKVWKILKSLTKVSSRSYGTLWMMPAAKKMAFSTHSLYHKEYKGKLLDREMLRSYTVTGLMNKSTKYCSWNRTGTEARIRVRMTLGSRGVTTRERGIHPRSTRLLNWQSKNTKRNFISYLRVSRDSLWGKPTNTDTSHGVEEQDTKQLGTVI